ncbi:MAG: DsbA family protein [Nocardioides sp.]|nr:DsbA family protein [Nocardioides sp.]
MPSTYKTSNSGNRNVVIGGCVAVVLLMIIAVGWAIQSNRDTSGEAADKPGGGSSQTTEPGNVAIATADEYGLGVGDPEAPVKVEIFEDFQCPYCQQLESATRDDLLQAAKDGDAYVVYRPMAFLNDYSSEALNAFGVVLDEVGGKAALEFHNQLFVNQPPESGPSPDTDWLIDLAKKSGAGGDGVASGIKDGDFDEWATNASDAASKEGITGTPAAFVNGEPVDGSTIQEMADNILSAINGG